MRSGAPKQSSFGPNGLPGHGSGMVLHMSAFAYTLTVDAITSLALLFFFQTVLW
jgi:hypothetical protein